MNNSGQIQSRAIDSSGELEYVCSCGIESPSNLESQRSLIPSEENGLTSPSPVHRRKSTNAEIFELLGEDNVSMTSDEVSYGNISSRVNSSVQGNFPVKKVNNELASLGFCDFYGSDIIPDWLVPRSIPHAKPTFMAFDSTYEFATPSNSLTPTCSSSNANRFYDPPRQTGKSLEKDFEAIAAHAQNTSNVLACGLHPLMEDEGEVQDSFH